MPRKPASRVPDDTMDGTPDLSRLETLVGKPMYAAWVQMLKTLVPDGRTHRLATLLAGMLVYAASLAEDEPAEDSAAAILVQADQDGYSEEGIEALAELVSQLFKDAGVEYERQSRAGEDYSIAQQAAEEFISWYNMPWE